MLRIPEVARRELIGSRPSGGASGNRLAMGVSQLRLGSIVSYVRRRRATGYCSVQPTRLTTPANERIDRIDDPHNDRRHRNTEVPVPAADT